MITTTKESKPYDFGRETVTVPQSHEISQKLRGIYSEPYCLHPDAPRGCSSKIINAHTVQNRGQLETIATRGHVYGVNLSYLNYKRGQSPFIKIGVNKASTYPCFCGEHDRKTFEPIEVTNFQFKPEQCFLLGYRAVCRGVYLARQQLKTLPLLRELARPHGTQNSVTDRSNIFFPPTDFNGVQLQSLEIGSPIHVVTASLLAIPGRRGAAVFVWHKQHDAVRVFVDSLRRQPSAQIPHAITRLVFSYFENSFLSPQWWEGLPGQTRASLERRFVRGIAGRDANALVDDGIRAVKWTVTAIHQE